MPIATPAGPTAPIRPSELRRALDEAFHHELPLVAGGLSGLYVFFVFADFYSFPEPLNRWTALMNVGMACVFLASAVFARRLDARWSHPLGAGLALLALGNSLVPYYWLGDPRQTTYLMLLALGVGVFFLHWRWLLLVLAATAAGWTAGLGAARPDLTWLTFGFSLLSAIVLGLLAHGMRLRTQTRLEGLHLSDERRNRQLLAAVEAMRQSEQRFRSLAEATSEGILVLDEDRVLDHNPAFARLFGWPPDDVDGRRLADFLDAASALQLEHVRYGGTRAPLRVLGVRRDGQTFALDATVKLTPFEGRFVRLVAFHAHPAAAEVRVAARG